MLGVNVISLFKKGDFMNRFLLTVWMAAALVMPMVSQAKVTTFFPNREVVLKVLDSAALDKIEERLAGAELTDIKVTREGQSLDTVHRVELTYQAPTAWPCRVVAETKIEIVKRGPVTTSQLSKPKFSREICN